VFHNLAVPVLQLFILIVKFLSLYVDELNDDDDDDVQRIHSISKRVEFDLNYAFARYKLVGHAKSERRITPRWVWCWLSMNSAAHYTVGPALLPHSPKFSEIPVHLICNYLICWQIMHSFAQNVKNKSTRHSVHDINVPGDFVS